MSFYTYLALSWSVSRGRDTYGYNIARLDDTKNGHRFRCNGGGYDMTGTVFGKWLQTYHQDALKALVSGAVPYVGAHRKHATLYGLFFKEDGTAYCDGACGMSSMESIAKAIGLTVRRAGNKRGQTIGFHVESVEPEEATK